MIELQLSHAVVLYALVLGVLAAIIWIFTELNVGRARHFLTKQHLWRCNFCGYTYLDDSGTPVTQCPRCESYNAMDEAQERIVAAHHASEMDPATTNEESEARRNSSHRKRKHGKRRGPRKRSR